jgi:2-haloacid dehalogenase
MTSTFSRALVIIVSVVSLVSLAVGDEASTPRFKAVAFDYLVLFDPNSIVPEVEAAYPGRGLEVTRMWRSKQFEYCFLRSLTNHHRDFYKVTEDALVYTAGALKLELAPDTRERLLNAYLNMKPWPDTVEALRKLKAAGVRVITLANFSPQMLQANADHAGLTGLIDELLSTETNETFKPDPRAYALGMQSLNLEKDEVLFAAFGSWDAYGAKSFGYPTIWVNRFGLPREELGIAADRESKDMNGLLQFALGK